MDDDPPIHDYADRMFRESLQQPDNLREFLREVLPDLADGFDVSQARLLSREYPMDDWRSMYVGLSSPTGGTESRSRAGKPDVHGTADVGRRTMYVGLS